MSRLDLFRDKFSKLYPWLKLDNDKDHKKQSIDKFYPFTYAYNSDNWEDRIEESADEDEAFRGEYIVKLCLEFSLDGKNNKPSLSKVWKDFHTFVVCPLYKESKSKELHEQYKSYSIKTLLLDEKKERNIWNEAYKLELEESEWIVSNFYSWIMDDLEYQKNKKPEPVRKKRLVLSKN